MRLLGLTLAGLSWSALVLLALGQTKTTKPSTLVRLFNSTYLSTTNLNPSLNSSSNTTAYPLPTLHTSLYTLLPLLPFLSPPPHHTLLTTLATSATKPLLLNSLCFLKHKAHWGALPPSYPADGPARAYEAVPKVLVITGDEFLAKDLAAQGVVVWWLKGLDFDDDSLDEDEAEEDRLIRDDAFLNVRLLEVLLPGGAQVGWQGGELRAIRETVLEPGSLQFQSLMLERSLAVGALVGGLVESQKVDAAERRREEAEWARRVAEHDWDDDEAEKPVRDEWVGVKGVLLADVDAVWLSSPSPFLTHPYRLSGPHPSFIHSVDLPPSLLTPYNSRTHPSSAFLYTRVADADAHHASSPLGADADPTQADAYSPASAAAQVWRYTALCHVAEVLKSFRKYRAEAEALAESGVGAGQGSEMKDLHWGQARGFAAASLGPAMFLAERAVRVWPSLGHDEWADVLRSGEPQEVLDLLADIGLATDDDPDDESLESCLSLAQRNHELCPNPHPTDPLSTSLTDPEGSRWQPLRTESLPYDLFPPGVRWFGGGVAEGVKASVVHANVGEAGDKEELLRKAGLWALGVGKEGRAKEGTEEGRWEEPRWTCDVEVVAKA